MEYIKLTIFTATYNRGYIIENLYRSLQRQKYFNFEWLVIDDGSMDNTRKLFEQWCKEKNPFIIRYYNQENQGLIKSLNRGIELAEGKYFAKIDSDDYVTDDYIEKVNSWISTIESEEKIYAVAGLRGSSKGIPLKGVFPKIDLQQGFVDASDLERAKYDLDADASEVWRMDVMKKYPFPVWEGEKFAPEQIVFYQIALDGWRIRWYPDIICVCEYQEDGLTKGASTLEKRNPMGYAMMYNHMLLYPWTIKKKAKAALQCNVLSIVGKNPKYILESNNIWLSLLMFLPSIPLSIRRKRQFDKLD